MEVLIYIFVFSFGIIVGSFLNCIIYRLSKKESFLSKRSYCPYCKKTLEWYDLIPLLSFLFLKGKCRYCQEPISIQYPLVEAFTGLLFLLIVSKNIDILISTFFVFGLLNIIFLFFITSVLIIIFVYDFKHYIIPDRVIFPAVLVSAIWCLGSNVFFKPSFQYCRLDNLYSAFLGAAFFLAMVLLSKGKAMGMGDVKLVFLMGLVLGFPNIITALFLSFLLGAIVGIVLIVTGKRKLKSEIPFAPFLVTGTFLALFWGEKMIDFYFNFGM